MEKLCRYCLYDNVLQTIDKKTKKLIRSHACDLGLNCDADNVCNRYIGFDEVSTISLKLVLRDLYNRIDKLENK